MLSARFAPFRFLSRSGHEALAADDPQERLQRRVRAPRQARIAVRLCRRGIERGNVADVAGTTDLARGRTAAATGRRHDPETCRRTAAAVSRSDRAAGDE